MNNTPLPQPVIPQPTKWGGIYIDGYGPKGQIVTPGNYRTGQEKINGKFVAQVDPESGR